MKKLLIFSYLFLICYINSTVLSNEQEKETTNIENNNISVDVKVDNFDIDFEKLFECEDLPKPKLIEPSFLKVWLRSYGLAFLYKFYDFKNWIVNKYKKFVVN